MDKAVTSQQLTVRVAAAEHVSPDVVRMRFEPAAGGRLPAWEAGAHVDVQLPSGLIRQYSLCGDSQDTSGYTVCVLREDGGRGGSVEVHRDLTIGSELCLKGPRNQFRLEPAPSYAFLAGGIGITPIKAMIDEAERTGREWTLTYGGRSSNSMVFGRELAERFPDRVRLVVEEVDGFIDVRETLATVGDSAHVYCCGPEGLLDAVRKSCDALGIGDRLHFERFAPGLISTEEVAQNSTFEVELRQSGVVVAVTVDQSLLEVVKQVRGDIDFSCQEGYCGSCESRVLEGEPDHRGTFMSPEEHDEEGTMLICVGRSRSPRLVLDL
jgi:ferredoxin-NADP reductase